MEDIREGHGTHPRQVHERSVACAVQVSGVEAAELWHRRLDHARAARLAQIATCGMVMGMHVSAVAFRRPQVRFCEVCMFAKHCRSPFVTFQHQHRPLDLLHADLCGPFRVCTLEGGLYMLVVLDDHSKFRWYASCVQRATLRMPSKPFWAVMKLSCGAVCRGSAVTVVGSS